MGRFRYVELCPELQKIIDDYKILDEYFLELIEFEEKFKLCFNYSTIIGSKALIFLNKETTEKTIREVLQTGAEQK